MWNGKRFGPEDYVVKYRNGNVERDEVLEMLQRPNTGNGNVEGKFETGYGLGAENSAAIDKDRNQNVERKRRPG